MARAFLLIFLSLQLLSCEASQQPDYFRVIHLEGSPYDRGYQHGTTFASEIRSLYTQILTASILPYLSRERADIAALLTEYQDPIYDDGQFSYLLMLEAAQGIEPDLPEEFVEEMHGIADGAGLPYEEILIFNTFIETMLSLRAITFFIRDMGAPYILSVTWDAGLDADGVDNDGDDEIDEEGEGTLDPYESSPRASMVEVPTDAVFRFLLIDQAGAAQVVGIDDEAEPEGVDPATVRIQLDRVVYESSDPAIEVTSVAHELGEATEVTFAPPGGFQPATAHAMILQAGDTSWVTTTPPPHANFMRDERITFTTEGYGEAPAAVDNRGEADGRTQPSSIAFAARDSATADGAILLAHHFALLDVNTAHKHAVLFVHHVDEGNDHAVLGWTGMIGAFTGMNDEGLAYAINPSDSLDISMVSDMLAHITHIDRARLLCTGIPSGILGRSIATGSTTADEAAAWLATVPRTFAWNVLVADRTGGMAAVELDSSILADGGYFTYGPVEGDEPGALASRGPDDLRIASHYVANTNDFNISFIRPQRFWSRYYYRSVRTFYNLGNRLDGAYGDLSVETMIEIMRDPDLVDPQDSMSAVVMEPETGRLHLSMGIVPATDGDFTLFNLHELFE